MLDARNKHAVREGFVPFFAFFWLNSIQILALLQSIPSQFGVTRQYPLLTVSLTLLLTVW